MAELCITSNIGASIVLESILVLCNNQIVDEFDDILAEETEWGEDPSSDVLSLSEENNQRIYMRWYSASVREKFSIEIDLPQGDDCDGFVIGISMLGLCAIWKYKMHKRFLYTTIKAKEENFSLAGITPWNPFVTYDQYSFNCCEYSRNLDQEDYPDENSMRQFVYKYVIEFKAKGTPEDKFPIFDSIEEALFDGTHDKLRDGGLMKYHEAGKPKKLAVSWHIGKSEYSAYFWFEDEGIREVFDRFYGAHPDTKTDFIIRIDAERRKYELALYRYGLKEPQVIPEDVYQLLVFKNKFEDYRSDNYNQERGAWIW